LQATNNKTLIKAVLLTYRFCNIKNKFTQTIGSWSCLHYGTCNYSIV